MHMDTRMGVADLLDAFVRDGAQVRPGYIRYSSGTRGLDTVATRGAVHLALTRAVNCSWISAHSRSSRSYHGKSSRVVDGFSPPRESSM